MTIIKSDGVMIICPKTNEEQKIHQCILTDCKYECGHSISYGGSEVTCMYEKSKQSTL